MKIRIYKEYKRFRLLLFFIIGASLILGLVLNEKINIYPDWQEPFHISFNIYDGDTHCLKSDYLDISIDTISKIATIKFNLYKDDYCNESPKGKIIVSITNANLSKPKGIENLYFLNETKLDSYEIILNTQNMEDKQYNVIIEGKILDKFYRNYFIRNNNRQIINFVKFSYDNKKYDCDNCFFLYEGDLTDKGNIPILRNKNIDEKEYYFEKENFVLFSFYPELKKSVLWKNSLRSLIISLIAGIFLFLLGEIIWKKRTNNSQ